MRKPIRQTERPKPVRSPKSDIAEAVPDSWALVQVGEVTELVNGYAFKISEWRETGIPIIRIQNLNDPSAAFNYFRGELPSKFSVREGDLLFAWSGTPGTSFGTHIWQGGEAWLNQHIFKVVFDERSLNKRYLQLALNQNLRLYIRQSQGGGGLGHITKRQVLTSLIALPPFEEQARIVEAIDTRFTRLDAGVSSLSRVQEKLEQYGTTLLTAACEGKLVENEVRMANGKGRTAETGEQLLKRILGERRQNWQGPGKYKEPVAPDTTDLPPLPEGWTYAAVETVGFVQLGRQRAPQHHTGANMRPYLRVANVFEDRLDLSDVKEMNFTPAEFEVFRLEPNDILLNEGQSLELVGRPALYQGELPGACFTNTLVRFRPCPSLHVKFALLVFRAFMHSGRFQKIAKRTTNIAHLGADRFAKLAFPLPPLAEQTRIVAEVERRLTKVEELEAVVEANLHRASQLREAILRRGFEGKLAPQSEGDTPVSELLEAAKQFLCDLKQQYKTENKTMLRNKKTMPQVTRTPLLAIIERYPKGITPEELFREAGYKSGEIDEFYQELAGVLAKVAEARHATKIRTWPDGNGIVLKPKGAN